jgi:hypothetical protein
MRFLASTLIALAGLAGCGEATTPGAGRAGSEARVPARTPAAAAATRTCAMVGFGGLAKDYRRHALVVGPIAFGNLRALSPREPLPVARGERHGAYEVIAIVNAGADLTISLPRSEWSTVGLLYDPSKFRDDGLYRLTDMDQAMRLIACKPPSFNHGVSQFDGGFVVTRPQCVRFAVTTADGRRYSGRFPAAAPCPS